MTFLVIFFLIAAGLVVAGVFARWQREGRRIMRDATRPCVRERGDEDRLFSGKRRRRQRKKRSDNREDYDVPLEIDLDGEEERDDELAPPPFDFDGMNPDER